MLGKVIPSFPRSHRVFYSLYKFGTGLEDDSHSLTDGALLRVPGAADLSGIADMPPLLVAEDLCPHQTKQREASGVWVEDAHPSGGPHHATVCEASPFIAEDWGAVTTRPCVAQGPPGRTTATRRSGQA